MANVMNSNVRKTVLFGMSSDVLAFKVHIFASDFELE